MKLLIGILVSHNYCCIIPVFSLNNPINCFEPMIQDSENMTMDELVDILAQKTQQFTQLLVYKNFGSEYKECKEAIQQILAQIELRKESMRTQKDLQIN